MYQLTKADIKWGWTFLALPILILVAGMTPGIMEVFYWEARFYTSCGLLTIPAGTGLNGLRFAIFSFFTYWIVCGILYHKKHENGILKVYLLLGFACALFLSLGLLMDGTHLHPRIKPWPYCLLPIACMVTVIMAGVRLVKLRRSRHG